MSRRSAGWRPALRIARRDALRARGRSALIVLMVMLPVAAVAFADVMMRTSELDARERLSIELGRAADARVASQGKGTRVLQRPEDHYATDGMAATGTAEAPQQKPPVDSTTLFPPGSRWITDDSGGVIARTTDGLTRPMFRELDYTDPLAQGTVTQVDGRAPRTTDEVVATTVLLRTLGMKVGDRVQLTRPERTLTIVGTYRSYGGFFGQQTFVGLPGTVLPELRAGTDGEALGNRTYLVDTPQPMTWAQVLQLNERGVTAYSRYVVEHPPPRSEVPLYANSVDSGGVDFAVIAAVALVVGLSVLEVSLLAGAAFAVGARRQSRALGLLAATGGTARQVRRVVLAQGLVLGAAGGAVGVAAGILAAYVAVPVANRWSAVSVPPPDIRPLELAALVALGVTTGLIAALLPARTAARQDVVAALRGRRGVVRTRRRLPVIGLVVAGVGAALALAGGAVALAANTAAGDGSDSARLGAVGSILGGAVLTQLGLIVATPALVAAAARLGRWLPLSPRLALRDAARHRGRSAPAVAAILAAVAGSVALSLFVSAQSDHERQQYMPSLGFGQYAVHTYQPPSDSGESPNDVGATIAAISAVAPPDDSFPVRTLSEPCDPESACRQVYTGMPLENMCPHERIQLMEGRDPTQSEVQAAEKDARCRVDQSADFGSRFSGPVVGGYRDFVRLTGIRSAEARRILDAGGMVVFQPAQVRDGRGFLNVTVGKLTDARSPIPTRVEVPAAYVDAGGPRFVDSFVAPAAAKEVGLASATEAIVLQYRTPPDDDTEEKVSAALMKLGQDGYFQVERGYRDQYGLGLLALLLASAVITLGSAGIATGLAQADARADHATLAAIGASPRVRRSLAAWHAAVIAGLGALLGTASGFVPMTAYLYAEPAFRLVVPWQNLAVIAVVVPLVAALGAGLLTRSRLPLERRLEE